MTVEENQTGSGNSPTEGEKTMSDQWISVGDTPPPLPPTTIFEGGAGGHAAAAGPPREVVTSLADLDSGAKSRKRRRTYPIWLQKLFEKPGYVPPTPEERAARLKKQAGGHRYSRIVFRLSWKMFRRRRSEIQHRLLFKRILYRSWRFGITDGLPDYIFREADIWRERGWLKPLRTNKPAYIKSVGEPPPKYDPKMIGYLICPSCRRPFYMLHSSIRNQQQHFCSQRCKQAMEVAAHLLIARDLLPTRFGTIELRLRYYSLVSANLLPEKHQHWAALVIKDLTDVMALKALISTGTPTLAPFQRRALRRRIGHVVEEAMDDVAACLKGAKKMDPQQVRLFLGLLDKLVPNASQTDEADEAPVLDAQKVATMSRAELEKIAASDPTLSAVYRALEPVPSPVSSPSSPSAPFLDPDDDPQSAA